MVCLSPLEAYYSKELNRTGKRSLVFDKREALSGVPINVPCGQCIGCRLQKSLDWAVRCVHEKSLHEESSFVLKAIRAAVEMKAYLLPYRLALHHEGLFCFSLHQPITQDFQVGYLVDHHSSDILVS